MPIRFLVALSFLLLPAICQAQLPNPDYYTVFQLTGGAGAVSYTHLTLPTKA